MDTWRKGTGDRHRIAAARSIQKKAMSQRNKKAAEIKELHTLQLEKYCNASTLRFNCIGRAPCSHAETDKTVQTRCETSTARPIHTTCNSARSTVVSTVQTCLFQHNPCLSVTCFQPQAQFYSVLMATNSRVSWQLELTLPFACIPPTRALKSAVCI